MTLTDFILARIAEDEAVASRAGSFAPWSEPFQTDNYGHLTVQPDRVLAECEAKRRIVEWHKPLPGLGGYAANCAGCWEDGGEDGAPLYPCRNIRWLAAVYADHEDYDESWRP